MSSTVPFSQKAAQLQQSLIRMKMDTLSDHVTFIKVEMQPCDPRLKQLYMHRPSALCTYNCLSLESYDSISSLMIVTYVGTIFFSPIQCRHPCYVFTCVLARILATGLCRMSVHLRHCMAASADLMSMD